MNAYDSYTLELKTAKANLLRKFSFITDPPADVEIVDYTVFRWWYQTDDTGVTVVDDSGPDEKSINLEYDPGYRSNSGDLVGLLVAEPGVEPEVKIYLLSQAKQVATEKKERKSSVEELISSYGNSKAELLEAFGIAVVEGTDITILDRTTTEWTTASIRNRGYLVISGGGHNQEDYLIQDSRWCEGYRLYEVPDTSGICCVLVNSKFKST